MSEIRDDLTAYRERAETAILDVCFLFDRSLAAEKMMNWHCVGRDNPAWQEGPYLSTGAGLPDVDRSGPYCMCLSLETRAAAWLVLGEVAPRDASKGVRIPVSTSGQTEWVSNRLAAKLAIIEQFEIYKDFAQQLGLPFNKTSIKTWRGKISQEQLGDLKKLVDRSNELVHGDQCTTPTMKEAVEYFNALRWFAEIFESVSYNTSAK